MPNRLGMGPSVGLNLFRHNIIIMNKQTLAVLPKIRPATHLDLPQINKLVRKTMKGRYPTNVKEWMGALGAGWTWQENYLTVAVEDGQVLAVALAGPAALQEYNIPATWWCLDIVAVEPYMRGRGLGVEMARGVHNQAIMAGATMLYGLCKPELCGWYSSMGFSTTEAGAVLESNLNVNGRDFSLKAPSDHSWFLTTLNPNGHQLYLP